MKMFLLALVLFVPLEAMAAERVESPWPGGVWLEDGKYYAPNSFKVTYTSDYQLVSTSLQQCVNGKCSIVQTAYAVPVNTPTAVPQVQLLNSCLNGQCETSVNVSVSANGYSSYGQQQGCNKQSKCCFSFSNCCLFKKCSFGCR